MMFGDTDFAAGQPLNATWFDFDENGFERREMLGQLMSGRELSDLTPMDGTPALEGTELLLERELLRRDLYPKLRISDERLFERAVERICRRFPGMEHGSLHSAHGGYDGITPDQRAILDQAGPDGFYLLCGFSGTGFKIAPAVGACMAERILDGQAKTVDISPFNLARFSTGAHLSGEHGYENVWR